jgi:ribosomal protein L19
VRVPHANIRLGPGISYRIHSRAIYGTKFIILDRQGSWSKIIIKINENGEDISKEVWIYSPLIEEITIY